MHVIGNHLSYPATQLVLCLKSSWTTQTPWITSSLNQTVICKMKVGRFRWKGMISPGNYFTQIWGQAWWDSQLQHSFLLLQQQIKNTKSIELRLGPVELNLHEHRTEFKSFPFFSQISTSPSPWRLLAIRWVILVIIASGNGHVCSSLWSKECRKCINTDSNFGYLILHRHKGETPRITL